MAPGKPPLIVGVYAWAAEPEPAGLRVLDDPLGCRQWRGERKRASSADVRDRFRRRARLAEPAADMLGRPAWPGGTRAAGPARTICTEAHGRGSPNRRTDRRYEWRACSSPRPRSGHLRREALTPGNVRRGPAPTIPTAAVVSSSPAGRARGVRFVQLYINAQIWDKPHHAGGRSKSACDRTDQPIAALLRDLKQRDC